MFRNIPKAAAAIIILIILLPLAPGETCAANQSAKSYGQVVKIGVVYPLSGPLASTGKTLRDGATLAADILNGEYGPDLQAAVSSQTAISKAERIELIFGDSAGLPANGSSETNRLIDEENVSALMGCYQSSVTDASAKVAEDKGIPFLDDDSLAPSLTAMGRKWFFRSAPGEDLYVQSLYQMLDDLKSARGTAVRRLAVVHENSIWGSEIAWYHAKYANESGRKIVENISYNPAELDNANASSLALRLKESRPDLVVQASYARDAMLFTDAYAQEGFRPQAIFAHSGGFVDPEYLRAVGSRGSYILVGDAWFADLASTKPVSRKFSSLFKERYGYEMNGDSSSAFTGIVILADALSRAGTSSPKSLREALLETNIPEDKLIMPWKGVKFDPKTGQNMLARNVIAQILGGQYRIVWPRDLATSEVSWPMPINSSI